MLAFFYSSVALILGEICLEDLRVLKHGKQIKFEGVRGELEARECFQKGSFTNYLRLTLVFM